MRCRLAHLRLPVESVEADRSHRIQSYHGSFRWLARGRLQCLVHLANQKRRDLESEQDLARRTAMVGHSRSKYLDIGDIERNTESCETTSLLQHQECSSLVDDHAVFTNTISTVDFDIVVGFVEFVAMNEDEHRKPMHFSLIFLLTDIYTYIPTFVCHSGVFSLFRETLLLNLFSVADVFCLETDFHFTSLYKLYFCMRFIG